MGTHFWCNKSNVSYTPVTKGRKPLGLFMPLWPKCIQWNPWSTRPPWWETTLLSRPLFQKPLQVYCLQNIIGSKIHESVYYNRDQNICDCANIVTEKLTCMQVHKLGPCSAYCLRLSALCQLLSDVNIEMCILHWQFPICLQLLWTCKLWFSLSLAIWRLVSWTGVKTEFWPCYLSWGNPVWLMGH